MLENEKSVSIFFCAGVILEKALDKDEASERVVRISVGILCDTAAKSEFSAERPYLERCTVSCSGTFTRRARPWTHADLANGACPGRDAAGPQQPRTVQLELN